MRESVPTARYSPVCNVLHQWKTSLILTYRVYRLYDDCMLLAVCYRAYIFLISHFCVMNHDLSLAVSWKVWDANHIHVRMFHLPLSSVRKHVHVLYLACTICKNEENHLTLFENNNSRTHVNRELLTLGAHAQRGLQ